MVETAFNLLEQSHLSYKLVAISIRELLFISEAPCDIYGLRNELYFRILKRNAHINKNILRDLIKKGQHKLFIHHSEKMMLMNAVQNKLVQVTRSLSVGNPVDKTRLQMNLMTINMAYLYDHPTDDELLKMQHQCAKNLAYFLISRPEIHEPLYRDYLKQKQRNEK